MKIDTRRKWAPGGAVVQQYISIITSSGIEISILWSSNRISIVAAIEQERTSWGLEDNDLSAFWTISRGPTYDIMGRVVGDLLDVPHSRIRIRTVAKTEKQVSLLSTFTHLYTEAYNALSCLRSTRNLENVELIEWDLESRIRGFLKPDLSLCLVVPGGSEEK